MAVEAPAAPAAPAPAAQTPAAPAAPAAPAPAAETPKPEGTVLGTAPAEPAKPAAEPAKPESAPAQPEKKDGQPAPEKKPEGQPEVKKDQPQGAPDKYADFKLPEGVTADATALDEFKALAKGLNLTQDAAQKLVDLQTKSVARDREAQLASFTKLKADWLEESKKAFGASYEADFATASKAIERFGPPEFRQQFRQFLNDSGFGNHPLILKFAHYVGKAVSEDKLPEGGPGPGGEAKPLHQLMYGDKMGAKK